ncbi:hypothetical protein VM1G_02064 [Cytospora mali]|uniref:Uncharacterized protein n=1 Tax=Cytospora mali TaxID=578113 RepID=A0A194VSY1_CYTMA|nr:hypothetical protein VM1G_02064 [Valsa mali]
MSTDNSNANFTNNNNNKPPSPPPADMHRRGSVTSAAFANLFQRSNSTATGTPVFPSAITTAALNEQRRRLSLTTTSLGLSSTSPTSNASFARRASLSTNNSDSLDENAVEEEDYPSSSRNVPVSPFHRRMSIGASTAMRRPGGNSPGSSNDQGFNWSEQLRSRAESTVASGRPSFSLASGMNGSPPRTSAIAPGTHERARSVSEMPAPPAHTPKPRSPPRDNRPKPDAFQERILKGDFYMD